jgi:glycosyltransferase involved in cell wall biosynthesis
MFNIINLLQQKGHTVIPFSVKHNKNVASEYEEYFLDPIGTGKEVYASEYNKKDLPTVVKTLSRMLYSTEAKNKLELLIEAVQPDLIYVLHYQNKISASIFNAAYKYKIPVVNRISDFGMICANSMLFRSQQKDVCERCIKGSKWNAVKNKCVQDSYIYSAIKAASLVIADKVVHVQDKINAFVVPSAFTIQKMALNGIDEKKLHHIPTFFSSEVPDEPEKISYQPFAVYLGRIVQEKGLFTLIKAFVNTKNRLTIIGFSNSGYQEELEQYLEGKEHFIEFVGRKEFNQLIPYLQTCAFTIVPSENYDNFPNSVLESYAFKKPVIASNLGSLKEMVNHEKTGLLFKQQDSSDLNEKVTWLLQNIELCKTYGENGYSKLLNEYGKENHYNKLIQLFNNLVSKK